MKKLTVVIFAVGVLLRALLIWQAPLWYDENFTLILARLPFDKMMAATAGDVHPPLWYLIEWITFHSALWPAWTLRLPALAFSALSMIAFWRVMEEMIIPRRVRLIAFALMAVLPMQIWYAQEARMYALLEFLVLAALYNALKSRWILFTVASIAMLYTQNYGVFYLASIFFAVIVIYPKKVDKAFVSCVIACVAFLPWAFVLSKQMGEISGRYWIMDSSGAAALAILQRLFFVSVLADFPAIAAHALVYIALIIGVWWMVRKSEYPSKWTALIMAFGPLAIAFVASIVWQPVMLFRPLIGSSPFLYLVAVWPLEGLTFQPTQQTIRKVMLYAACFALPLIVSADILYYQNVSAMKSSGDTRPILDVLTYIRAHWQPGDVIYHTDDGSLVNFMPYSADLPQYRMPGCAEKTGYAPVLGSLSNATREAMNVHIADLSAVPHKRAWVLAPHSPLHPACYDAQIAPLTQGEPVLKVDDNEFIQSGLWLLQ